MCPVLLFVTSSAIKDEVYNYQQKFFPFGVGDDATNAPIQPGTASRMQLVTVICY